MPEGCTGRDPELRSAAAHLSPALQGRAFWLAMSYKETARKLICFTLTN